MAITSLRDPGELVAPGDVVVQFDTTEQEFNLKEAEADLAEAEQQVIKAEADSVATDEESHYAMLSAAGRRQTRPDSKSGAIPLIAAIAARQNDIAPRSRPQSPAPGHAGSTPIRRPPPPPASQSRRRRKTRPRSWPDIARKNIENMTLKAKTGGYVNVQQNSNQNMIYWGMQLPPFQLGDTARAGMAVAQIPDLKSWEVSANVGELDRGHLTVGQQVTISVVALAGKEFAGKVKNIGGTSGPPWDRRFEARIALDHAAPELRPGMTSNMVITVDTLDNVLWIPSQALFESDGRTFIYVRGPTASSPTMSRSSAAAKARPSSPASKRAKSSPCPTPINSSRPRILNQNGAMKALAK